MERERERLRERERETEREREIHLSILHETQPNTSYKTFSVHSYALSITMCLYALPI